MHTETWPCLCQSSGSLTILCRMGQSQLSDCALKLECHRAWASQCEFHMQTVYIDFSNPANTLTSNETANPWAQEMLLLWQIGAGQLVSASANKQCGSAQPRCAAAACKEAQRLEAPHPVPASASSMPGGRGHLRRPTSLTAAPAWACRHPFSGASHPVWPRAVAGAGAAPCSVSCRCQAAA